MINVSLNSDTITVLPDLQIHIQIQIHRPTDIYRERDRRADKQTDRQTDSHTQRHINEA